MLLNVALAQNNAAIEFHIYVDRTPPVSDSLNYSPVINSINDNFSASAHWSDDYAVKEFVFNWNISGEFVSDSPQSLINDWSNITKWFNPVDEGKTIGFTISAVDYSGNWNNTGINVFTISNQSPDYSQVSESTDSPLIGESVSISSFWSDNFEVTNVTLQTNESGYWHDNGSPVIINSINGWANFTIDTTGMNNSPYYWRLIGFDAISNSNTTPPQFFTPQ